MSCSAGDTALLPSRRLVYVDHETQTCDWIPPTSADWSCPFGLPYGWELAVDSAGKPYYINHEEQWTTYERPWTAAAAATSDEPSEPRDVLVRRDERLGFGFVAGSERPVIIRFVTDGGPSADKLLPGDHILAVNGDDVCDATKDAVVALIRNCSTEVRLLVCQPRGADSNLKSSLLSASKKARLKGAPSRVRFASGVTLGTPDAHPTDSASCGPFMPNVLRVFLENGQTRSFKYDHSTTVEDVLSSLREKLALSCVEHFALVLEHPQGPRSNKLSLLRRNERLTRVAARPGAQHFRCLLRLAFVPADVLELHKSDAVAFDYYYRQCVNDVVAGRFAYEMRYEACVRLAALHMRQVAVDTHVCSATTKVSLKQIEKEYGLGAFLPSILLENVKRKEIRKHLRFYLKRDMERASIAHQQILSQTGNNVAGNNNVFKSRDSEQLLAHVDLATALRVKYVTALTNLPTFGGRSFCVTFKDTNTDMLMYVQPKQGVVVTHNSRATEPAISIPFDLLSQIEIAPDGDVLRLLTIRLKNSSGQALQFLIDRDDVDDLVQFVQGYAWLNYGDKLACVVEQTPDEQAVPPYVGMHSVWPAGWNYDQQSDAADAKHERLADFSHGPPAYADVAKKVQFSEGSKEMDDERPPAETPTGNSVTVDVHSEFGVSDDEDDDGGDAFSSDLLAADSRRLGNFERPQLISEQVPSKFLSAKDSLLVRNRQDAPVVKARTFLRAKDSLLLRVRPKTDGSPTADVAAHSLLDKLPSSEMSSSDTESLNTPTESPLHRPAKQRPCDLPAQYRSRPPPAAPKNVSFGMQSPDTLPCRVLSGDDIDHMVGACGVGGQNLDELLLLFPDKFCADSDIIDLTALPSPSDGAPAGKLAAEWRTLSEAVPVVSPPTPFRDDVDAKSEFRAVMERMTRGDVAVIDDSHRHATKHVSADASGDDWAATPTKTDAFPTLRRDVRQFEAFVAQSIIPPPPKWHRPDEGQPSGGRNVRFAASAPSPTGRRLTTVNAPASARSLLTLSRSTAGHMDEPTSKEALLRYLQADDDVASATDATEQRVRKVSLKQFSGLEESEHEPPTVTSLPLKDFIQVELLQRGTQSIEITTSSPKHGAAKNKRKMFARIRSVDPHTVSPERSPRRTSSTSKMCITALEQPSTAAAFSAMQHPALKVITENPCSPDTAVAAPTRFDASLRARSISLDGADASFAAPKQPHNVGNGCLPGGAASPTEQQPTVGVAATRQCVAELITQIGLAVDRLPSRSPRRGRDWTNEQQKLRLLAEAQQLAAASKVLVRGVSEGAADAHVAAALQLATARARSTGRAAEVLLGNTDSLFRAQLLGAKVHEVLAAFDVTLEALLAARGAPLLGSAEAKLLARRSTTLAAALTQLIQAVRQP